MNAAHLANRIPKRMRRLLRRIEKAGAVLDHEKKQPNPDGLVVKTAKRRVAALSESLRILQQGRVI